MGKSTENNIMGIIAYFLTAVMFGGGVALIVLTMHEDNDRCHFYAGKWNKGDLLRGCVAVALGMVAHYAMGKYIVG